MEQTRNRPHRLARFASAANIFATSEGNETLVRQYLEWKSSYARPAARMYARWVRRFQQRINKTPEEITLGDWTAFARSLDGRFAPKSVEFALNIVHNYLRFWHEQGRLRRLPLYLARVPKAISQSHLAISEEECGLMVAALRKEGGRSLRDLAIVMLLHDTGMRVGELATLEIDQIEEDATAVIRTEKTVRRRRVFWNQDTDDVVHNLIVERVSSRSKSDWLFVAKRGGGETPLTTRMMQRIIKRTCRLAGIERHLSPHSFRHAYIHRQARLGTPDAIIAQLVGHSTSHTIAHYTKLSRPEFSEYGRRQFATPCGLALAE